MGLDFAEVVIVIEETFNVDIFEEGVQGLETFGDLLEMIEKQIEHTRVHWEEAENIRDEFFKKISEKLALQRGCHLESLTEETELEAVIPLDNRSECWQELRREFPGTPPLRLKMPPCFSMLIIEGAIITSLLAIAYKALEFYPTASVVAAVISVWIALILFRVVFLVKKGRTEFPYGLETILDLVRHNIANKVSLDRSGNPWNRESIEASLKNIFVEEMGFKPQDIDTSSRLREMF